ncbi:GIY-YIG nuclease family protein [Patescibacteria group bacterium]|nr:GIY-YIG nuclease family protein [Patescibacteria group bacterium]
MFYVYILRSKKSNGLYIGPTNNLKRRIVEHNSGKSSYTKKYMPYELIYFEAYKAEADARKREHNLKLRANAFNQTKRRLVESLKTD